MSWLVWACLSALFAGMTAILAKVGVKDIDSNLATTIRTSVILVFAWTIALFGNVREVFAVSQKTWLFLGLSGLATAATFVGRGLKITIFESRPRLGGRAAAAVRSARGVPAAPAAPEERAPEGEAAAAVGRLHPDGRARHRCVRLQAQLGFRAREAALPLPPRTGSDDTRPQSAQSEVSAVHRCLEALAVADC